MKPKVLLRFASILLVVFALEQTVGYFTRHDTKDIRIQKVLKVMTENKFNMYGQMRSYDENYNGMALDLIFSLIAFSAVLWVLSIFAERNRVLVRTLLLPISFGLLGFSITGFLFFFPIPAYTSLFAAVLALIAMFSMVKKSLKPNAEF